MNIFTYNKKYYICAKIMESKSKTRFGIDLDVENQKKLAEIAKNYKLSQGEVVEVMLSIVNMTEHDDAFKKRREDKLARRASVKKLKSADKSTRDLLEKLQELPPEKRLELLASINKE